MVSTIYQGVLEINNLLSHLKLGLADDSIQMNSRPIRDETEQAHEIGQTNEGDAKQEFECAVGLADRRYVEADASLDSADALFDSAVATLDLDQESSVRYDLVDRVRDDIFMGRYDDELIESKIEQCLGAILDDLVLDDLKD